MNPFKNVGKELYEKSLASKSARTLTGEKRKNETATAHLYQGGSDAKSSGHKLWRANIENGSGKFSNKLNKI